MGGAGEQTDILIHIRDALKSNSAARPVFMAL
jgi:hypothetical protein